MCRRVIGSRCEVSGGCLSVVKCVECSRDDEFAEEGQLWKVKGPVGFSAAGWFVAS